jgi:deoxyribodipyrimidine photo-lyase
LDSFPPTGSADQGAHLPRYRKTLVWFRRDLRCDDHAALHYALRQSDAVHCAFVFDRAILDRLPSRSDRRVEFIWGSVLQLKAALTERGGDLHVLTGVAAEEIPTLAQALRVEAVFTNEDYEPAAIARDDQVAAQLAREGRALHRFKDQVIFAGAEVLSQTGEAYTVFTPYKNAWLRRLTPFHRKPYPVAPYLHRLTRPASALPMPTLEHLGFAQTNLAGLGITSGMSGAAALVDDFARRLPNYKRLRDYPGQKGVSYLSLHNRFGTVSIRALVNLALTDPGEGGQTWLSELIWRDFYFQILLHHPHAARGAFKPMYDSIRWPGEVEHFRAWCEARTGYPIVDAAMRQLNQTGYMHNRLRMIVASFLVKDLLIDWRAGEQYFAEQLNDFDLAANNGGWQWAASTGCDAQPYFRIFNPVSQSERFDPDGRFIRRYLPELARVPDRWLHAPWTMPPLEQQACGILIGVDYPGPIVDHAAQRDRALALFKGART